MSEAKIVSKAVPYKHGDVQLEGWVYYDDAAKGKRPGVLVVHEWYGLGDYAKRRAEMLAKLGYVAFAADMYGKGVYAKTHEEAGKLAGAVRGDRTLMRGRAMAAVDQLKAQPGVDAARLAAIGYCFGGTTVLELGRMGAPLKGVASFHGSLDTPLPAQKGAVKAKVLVLHGADDKHVGPQVPAFEDEMRQAGADWQLVAYGGAVHSFTVKEAGDDPSKGMAYHADADRRSWKALLDFFQELF
jgi:dienelactone hydrolase